MNSDSEENAKDEKRIKELYNNPKTGLKGLKAFAKEQNLPYEAVKETLKYEPSYQMNQQVVKNFPTRRVYISGPHIQYAADLADVSNDSDENDNIKFLLVVLDGFTKKAFVYPLKNKTAEEVVRAFTDLIENKKAKFEKLQTDQGKEFWNSKLQSLLEKHKITLFSTVGSNTKAAIAERFIRTLRQRIGRFKDFSQTHRFIDDLDDIVEGYNNTVHSSTGFAPNMVRDEHTEKILEALYGVNMTFEIPPPKFHKGDYVRISTLSGPFAKEGNTQRWTEGVFKVDEVVHTLPTTYKLKDLSGEDITGAFYEQEMVITNEPKEFKVEKILESKGRGKNKKYLIKWLGYSDKDNTWEPPENIPEKYIKEFEKEK